MIHLVGISGSLRRGSYNSAVLRAAVALAPEDCRIEVASIAEIPLYDGDVEAHEGVPAHCALFARVPGDWKYDWINFARECRKARWEGPQMLRIERV